VERFFFSVPAIFEAWVGRRKSEHTRRAYRGDVMGLVEFTKWPWPQEALSYPQSRRTRGARHPSQRARGAGAGHANRFVSASRAFASRFPGLFPRWP
jgi:hypothetical protein